MSLQIVPMMKMVRLSASARMVTMGMAINVYNVYAPLTMVAVQMVLHVHQIMYASLKS